MSKIPKNQTQLALILDISLNNSAGYTICFFKESILWTKRMEWSVPF